MSQKWFSSVSITADYQRLSDLLNSLSGFPASRMLLNGRLRVALDSTRSIRISRVPPSMTTGSDALSNLFAPGEDVPFQQLNAEHVYVKTDSGNATLEVQTDEL